MRNSPKKIHKIRCLCLKHQFLNHLLYSKLVSDGWYFPSQKSPKGVCKFLLVVMVGKISITTCIAREVVCYFIKLFLIISDHRDLSGEVFLFWCTILSSFCHQMPCVQWLLGMFSFKKKVDRPIKRWHTYNSAIEN